jgi:hypothetical protein
MRFITSGYITKITHLAHDSYPMLFRIQNQTCKNIWLLSSFCLFAKPADQICFQAAAKQEFTLIGLGPCCVPLKALGSSYSHSGHLQFLGTATACREYYCVYLLSAGNGTVCVCWVQGILLCVFAECREWYCVCLLSAGNTTVCICWVQGMVLCVFAECREWYCVYLLSAGNCSVCVCWVQRMELSTRT